METTTKVVQLTFFLNVLCVLLLIDQYSEYNCKTIFFSDYHFISFIDTPVNVKVFFDFGQTQKSGLH
jgi:hypothetical protein